MSPMKTKPRTTWLLVIISSITILSACAPIELDVPADDTLTPSKPAPAFTAEPSLVNTISPSPFPTSTRLPIFGKQVANPQFFGRAERYNLESQDLYSPGESRFDLNLSQVVDITGFVPLDISPLPPGYELDEMIIFTKEKSVQQCFNGPRNRSGMPRLCIVQQSTPFQELVGQNAKIFYLETRELYFEYVYGGWLAYGKSESGSRIYQWDNRMVPSVLVRYIADGLFTEISYMRLCDAEGCLELRDLISIAERQG